ncbi:magnesium-transporting ATPase [Verticillium alfalfae VaMs.102]|uniref:Magnesium-transporting ATPase, P-type 1 n=1 Tax=Verticillium alfalfae (strain VaMs.102 / ATCC MYA-4576 / FGSC 10136) TaxID=526221 RepID=C9SA33_VERA1|nr:magnesium-transporting ATPase [Verticillium alfalfae VaMs.102]EEY16246.1 magnesium-transporting ATPase [Verticillium alfalfae VaMs.102]
MFDNMTQRIRSMVGQKKGSFKQASYHAPSSLLTRAGSKAWGIGSPVTCNDSAESRIRQYAETDEIQLLAEFHSVRHGLTTTEAADRRKIHGLNIVSSKKPPSWWLLLLLVLPNPFNLLLTFIAIISVASPGRSWVHITITNVRRHKLTLNQDTFAVLMAMVVISSAVRFWQEYRSIMSVAKLQSSVTADVKVRRSPSTAGASPELPTDVLVHEKNVVPGDVIVLSPGDTIAADCILLETNYLRISQSSLTGESMPITKAPATFGDEKTRDISLFDLTNVAFMGSSVVSGSGLAVVIGTGNDTFIASTLKQLSKRRDLNAFQRGIRNVSYMLIGFMLVMVPIVLAISGKVTGDWGQAALFSISVAVGLVPEMLPAIVNTNLARGAHILSKKKAIVKRLDAIQNLGAMSILCSDKVVMRHNVDCAGLDHRGALQLAYINAFSQGNQGNNMDAAIIKYRDEIAKDVDIPFYEKVAVSPFTFERRRSAAIVRGITKAQMLICKGAFEEILGLCIRVRRGIKDEPIDAATRSALTAEAGRLAVSGYRVLLVATRQIPDFVHDDEDSFENIESNMTLEGMLTFLDPVKDDAAESVARLRASGVEVKILTGDNLGVAVNICQAINLVDMVDHDDLQAITGPELARLEGTDEYDEMVLKCKVFAKLTPMQKAQIVNRLKAAGNCVGMLGDGVNDCIALRAADVGVSVDSGTRAAKDSADDGVRVGRVTQGNSIKYIKMSSLQLLVQNLLYDVSQVAIPWDRMDDEYLEQPKQWASLDLLRFIIVLGPTSSTIDMCTFCIGWFYYGIQSADDASAVSLFQTHWFLQGLLTQTLIVHLLRTAKIPVFQSRAAPILVFATCGIMLIGFIVPYIPPFWPILDMVRPADTFVGILAAELVAYCIIVQFVKMAYIRVFKSWL